MNNYILAIADFSSDPMILFFGAFLGLALMVLSRKYKAGIFSIASVGIWVFMIFLVQDSIPLIIVFIVLIIEELWYSLHTE